MSEQIKNSATSALAAGIGSGDASLSVQTGQGANFPTSGNFRLVVDNEIMLCTARTGDTLTVTRAQEGTSAAAHVAGASVVHILTAGGLVQLISDKIASAGSSGSATVASATSMTVTTGTVLVTGGTTIDTITYTGAAAGQELILIFQATNTVRHNGGGTGNIRLAGGWHAGFVANETLSLRFDGTNWIEENRSPKHLSGQGGVIFNGTTTPSGYFAEDGSAISRTTYAALFANQGTTFGAGDGSTTFNLADSRGRMDVGYASGGHSDVASVGNNEGVSFTFRRPKHQTSLSQGSHSHSESTANSNGINQAPTTAGWFPFSQNVGATTGGATASITVGTGNANDPVDAPAYLVRQKFTRV